jgi:predicted class III extradiol MEMO1 family dioxygenase
MDTIEKLEPHAFAEYLKNTQNTICGRYPICVLLNVSAAICINYQYQDLKYFSCGMVHQGISRRVLRDTSYDPGH